MELNIVPGVLQESFDEDISVSEFRKLHKTA
jgi:hypothetical protein